MQIIVLYLPGKEHAARMARVIQLGLADIAPENSVVESEETEGPLDPPVEQGIDEEFALFIVAFDGDEEEDGLVAGGVEYGLKHGAQHIYVIGEIWKRDEESPHLAGRLSCFNTASAALEHCRANLFTDQSAPRA